MPVEVRAVGRHVVVSAPALVARAEERADRRGDGRELDQIGSTGDGGVGVESPVEVDRVVNGVLFHVRQHQCQGAECRPFVRGGDVVVMVPPLPLGPGEAVVDRVVVVHRQADLLQVVRALRATSGLTSGLNGRQQERDEHADDGDHDQKLDEGKALAFGWAATKPHQFSPSFIWGRTDDMRDAVLLKCAVSRFMRPEFHRQGKRKSPRFPCQERNASLRRVSPACDSRPRKEPENLLGPHCRQTRSVVLKWTCGLGLASAFVSSCRESRMDSSRISRDFYPFETFTR